MSAPVKLVVDRLAREVVAVVRLCWQCGHPEEDHTVEDRGCTDPDCSCAQVPQA